MDMGQDSLKEPANPGTWGSSLNFAQTNTPQGWNRKDQLLEVSVSRRLSDL